MSEELDAKVLLVDDEEDFCDLLSERLGNRGMKVNTVNSGEDALSKVENESFDAICGWTVKLLPLMSQIGRCSFQGTEGQERAIVSWKWQRRMQQNLPFKP